MTKKIIIILPDGSQKKVVGVYYNNSNTIMLEETIKNNFTTDGWYYINSWNYISKNKNIKLLAWANANGQYYCVLTKKQYKTREEITKIINMQVFF